MDTLAKTENAPSIAISDDEIPAAALLDRLAAHAGKPLAFHYEGRDVLPGYHVTEVKSGVFEALDCGANFERWHETFIQLWDVPGESATFMPVSKFLAIIGKVTARVPLDAQAKLTFEVSDGVRPIQLYAAASIAIADGVVRVQLTRRPASCKPRDRWLEQQVEQPRAACCGPVATAQACCG
jgi:hypothetical protein